MHKSILVISIMLLSFFSKTVSAQYDAEVFFKNLKFIIAASEANNNYASLKGELLSPPTWKRKIYSSTIKLSEFESTLTEIDSVLFF